MNKININRADRITLTKLIHIGPKRSAEIMVKRPFRDIYELSNILGLGKKRMKEIIEQGLAEV